MPPTRTIPPAKAVKTERTHEENQERAYIAASRRSDRSLEARVESARRASEIHKRRTGRSLRVTEQDVVNEEMYEEEDDDMPFQYRRLTAHLQTNSADFNRRLQDYLTTHVAMRSALANSYALNGQQFPGNQQYSNAMMFPSPMRANQQQAQNHQQLMQPPMMQPRSPTVQRQAPYPPPSPSHDSSHQRSSSIATPQHISSQTNRPEIKLRTERSLSVPTIPQNMASELSKTPASAIEERHRPSFPQGTFAQLGQSQTQSNAMFPSYNVDNQGACGSNSYSSFSTALPAESQMFLGSTLNPDDPLTSMFMTGANPSQFYDFSSQLPPTMSVDKYLQYPTFDGLDSTLAPSNSHEASIDSGSFFDQAADFSRTGTTPADTPGVNGESWASFIDTDQWDMPSSQQ